MSTPEILHQNLLAIAQAGRGDGTIYATATSAAVDQDAKTLTLTGLSIMTDLGADANDKFNGYTIYFPASERSYLCVDWVAAGDVATVFEYPNITDTTACEFRRTLYTDDFSVANPIRYASNGQLEKKWIDKAANNTAAIYAALPNGVDDGGFELNLALDGTNPYWTRTQAGTGTVAINAGGPILGTYDCKFNLGDQTAVSLTQAGKIDLKKDKTYGVIFKAGGDGGAVTDFRVRIDYISYGDTAAMPVTFTKINAGDTLTDAGNGTDNLWKPAITDANAWEEATFTVLEDINAGDWGLRLDQYDATDVFIDEIYLWEIGPTPSSGLPNPGTLTIGNHNHAGGYAADSELRAMRTQADLSSWSGPNDTESLVDVDADITVNGNATIYHPFTVTTSIYPIFRLVLSAISGKTWEAGEIWVGERWSWERFISGDWAPVDQEIRVASSITIGGNKKVSERYRQRLRAGSIATLTNAEADIWESFIKETGLNKPFWYYIAAIGDLGLAAEIMLMRNRTVPRLPMNADRFRSATYDFEEVL